VKSTDCKAEDLLNLNNSSCAFYGLFPHEPNRYLNVPGLVFYAT